MLLYISFQQHFANTLKRSTSIDFPSGAMPEKNSRLWQSSWIFGQTILANGNAHTLRVRTLVPSLGIIFEKSVKQTEWTGEEIAFDSNKWELVTFCVKDKIVLILMWLSLAIFSFCPNEWCFSGEFDSTFHLLSPTASVLFLCCCWLGCFQQQSFITHTPTFVLKRF